MCRVLILSGFVPFCFSDQESRKGDHGNRALLGLIRAEHESSASNRWLQAIPRFQRAGLRFMKAASLSRAKCPEYCFRIQFMRKGARLKLLSSSTETHRQIPEVTEVFLENGPDRGRARGRRTRTIPVINGMQWRWSCRRKSGKRGDRGFEFLPGY